MATFWAMYVPPAVILSRLLKGVATHLDGLEQHPRTFAHAAESLWIQVITATELRQSILRPQATEADPRETYDAFHAFDALVLGEVRSIPLFVILREEGRLAELPGLLADAARWIAREYPPEGTGRAEGAHSFRWKVFGTSCRDCTVETSFRGPTQFFRVKGGKWSTVARSCPWAAMKRANETGPCASCGGQGLVGPGLLCPYCGGR